MAVVRPFQGTRYNTRHVGDLAKVIAPPYDVISEAMRKQLCDQSPYNVVRIDLGSTEPGDDSYTNRYTRSASIFTDWRHEGALIDDEKPSLYIYSQEFDLPDGRHVVRSGIYAAVELMKLGPEGVMPHERTFEGPKTDRFNLTAATHANFSAVFALYSDAEGKANKVIGERMAAEKPWASASTADGITHRMWVVNDAKFISAIQEILADKSLYIADGHHRYETAMRYASHCRESGIAKGAAPTPSDHVLMYLVNTEDPGLEILPTHRVLRRDLETDVAEFKEDVSEHFDLTPIGFNWDTETDAALKIQTALAKAGKKATSFAVLLPGGEGFLMTLKDGADIDEMITDDMPVEKKSLDATILHFHVINQHWIGNPEYDIDEEECAYVRDIDEAMDLLRAKKHCIAFLMNSTTMDQLKAISAIGERMPQKSTYFFPKIATGTVLRDMKLPM